MSTVGTPGIRMFRQRTRDGLARNFLVGSTPCNQTNPIHESSHVKIKADDPELRYPRVP
jgi:hypothetical protein